jgi:hypothetical protein
MHRQYLDKSDRGRFGFGFAAEAIRVVASRERLQKKEKSRCQDKRMNGSGRGAPADVDDPGSFLNAQPSTTAADQPLISTLKERIGSARARWPEFYAQ